MRLPHPIFGLYYPPNYPISRILFFYLPRFPYPFRLSTIFPLYSLYTYPNFPILSGYLLYLVYSMCLSGLFSIFIWPVTLFPYPTPLSTTFPLSYLFIYHISPLLSVYLPFVAYTICPSSIVPLYYLSIFPILSNLFSSHYPSIHRSRPVLSVYLPYTVSPSRLPAGLPSSIYIIKSACWFFLTPYLPFFA